MATIARNIGATGRRQRLVYGAVLLVIGIAATGLLVTGVGGVSRGARLLLFLPFLGAVELLQARDHLRTPGRAVSATWTGERGRRRSVAVEPAQAAGA
jgi:hypothetical protein